jgi:hypothetical protein
MSGTGEAAAQGSGNNASEFVSRAIRDDISIRASVLTIYVPGSQAFQVNNAGTCRFDNDPILTRCFRMLEDPSHQDVARWGKDGDSFVVVEVRSPQDVLPTQPTVR